MMGSRLRRLGRALAKGVLTTAVLAIALELLLRLFGYGSYIIYQPDEKLLWVPEPSQQGLTVVGHQRITINANGLRYPSDLPARDPAETRVYLFGDSVTMGWGMDDASTYAAVLERQLASEAPEAQYRVISAGVNAYPTTLCVNRFERLLASGQQIDGAVLAYSFNLNHDALARLSPEERRTFLRRVRIKGLVRRSAIYNLVIEGWLREMVYYRIRDRLVAGSWQTEPFDRRGSEVDLGYYRSALERMRSLAEDHGIDLAFLLLGTSGQHDGPRPFQQAFGDFARQHDIELVDMVEILRNEEHGPLYADHVHPSKLGHERIAEALLPVVLGWRSGDRDSAMPPAEVARSGPP